MHVASFPKRTTGVLDNAGPVGNVRLSALKQYGFALGDAQSGYEATPAAKELAAAPEEDIALHYRKAALNPKVFKAMFDTFHGDTVSTAKLKQRAAQLKVHPDVTADCVEHYVSSLEFAKLVTVNGDQVTHVTAANLEAPLHADAVKPDKSAATVDLTDSGAEGNSPLGAEETPASPAKDVDATHDLPRAVFHVNVTLDSSLDTEKLAKQLELLKRFGAI
jgi:hypothetical protein